MYTYIHAYMHLYIHTYTYIHKVYIHTNTYVHTYIHTYMRTYVQLHVLDSLGNLIVAQFLNKLSAFYETQRIAVVLAKLPTASLPSQTNLVYTLPPCSFKTRLNIPSHLCLGVQCGLFASGTLISFVFHLCHNNRPFHPS